MSTGLIFTGGDFPSYDVFLSVMAMVNADNFFIVAADSGLEICDSYGFVPDVIVGDMDSLSDVSLLDKFRTCEIYKYPQDKDYTDTELAINIIREKNIKSFFIVGGGGGRVDQLLGIYSIFFRDFFPDLWITGKEAVFSLNKGKYYFSFPVKSTVSFFPVCIQETLASTTGFKWPLDGLRWIPGDVGISNVVVETKQSVDVLSGRLLLVLNLFKV
ncbi:thiamine diphosphokinase [Spirochaetia bacterium 38H-sp]|uniref:Thiamine diphosphokinase n=1 Tax=Rarispira pelagica TaxID=3141764 RepID=A0ABU9UAR8_9SPIR